MGRPQVEAWIGIDHAHTLLVRMLARAADAGVPGTTDRQPRDHESSADPVPLTFNEIRRLLAALTAQPPPPAFILHWSRWRRRHQATAQQAHYRRRLQSITN